MATTTTTSGLPVAINGRPPISSPSELEQAMYRLASQHHLSDYNRMRRGAQTISPATALPAASSATGKPNTNLHVQGTASTSTTGSHPVDTQAQRALQPILGHVHSSSLTPPPQHSGLARSLSSPETRINTSSTQTPISPNRRAVAEALLCLNSGTAKNPELKQTSSARILNFGEDHQRDDVVSQPRSNPLTRPQPPSLEPPPAPKLHRTFTEEEGNDPHAQSACPNLLPSHLTSASIGISPSLTIISTPSLSHSVSSVSSSTGSLGSTSFEISDTRMRGRTPSPPTPPDSNSLVNQARKHLSSSDGEASLSPTMMKTYSDEQNEINLSSRLVDAMGDILVPSSPSSTADAKSKDPIKPSTNAFAAAQQRAQQVLQGLGFVRPALGRAISSPRLQAGRVRAQASIAGYIPLLRPATSREELAATQSQSAQVQATQSASIAAALTGVKTSHSHPMNVSHIIPPELLALYGQTMLGFAPTPDQKITCAGSSNSPEKGLSIFSQSSKMSTAAANMQPPLSPKRSRSPLGKSRRINVRREDDPCEDVPSSPSKAAFDNPPRLARPHSPTKFPSSSSKVEDSTGLVDNDSPFVLPPTADLEALLGQNASTAVFELARPISQTFAATSGGGSRGSSPPIPLRLGNMVLSSCPGKKVRLLPHHLSALGIPAICTPGSDPRMAGQAAVQIVAGKGPICRDIKADFERAIEQADIKAVVCCIDDTELAFLGAAWPEYNRVASELGIEVVRLPMAEGFAPPTPAVLDAHLAYVISKFTLQGKTVLVHCRGGVGRAGLFACGWMIKLGLLGSVAGIQDPAGETIEGEMALTERVIQIIRRRRSAKAIETPQQVHFILQYVHWLATSANVVSPREAIRMSLQSA